MASKTTSTSSKPTGAFKTFPEFSKLTYLDREKYEAMVKDLPPMSVYSFPTLMNWWNTLNTCAVSVINGNLVLSYWQPGHDSASGISLIGTNDVDESVCEMFDHLSANGETARLVHVPEFVIGQIQHPELFKCTPERDYDEYVFDVGKFYPINKTVSFRRHRIKKFMSHVKDLEINVKSLDLSKPYNKRLLLECSAEVPRKGTANDLVKHSDDALEVAIKDAEFIGTENVCIFIGGKLHAFMLYSLPANEKYMIFSHVKLRYEFPYMYDYMVYAFSQWFVEHGITYANLDGDMGVPLLRMLKLALGPTEFFRKYTIEPAS